MKKNIKKKTDKYIHFRNSTNNANYRNKKIIIDQFNKSVSEYKRFSEIYNGGDEELASSKLCDAGTDLYMCCEWALKNYLYRRYDEQLATHEIPDHSRNYKVDLLSSKEATIVYLLDELKEIGIPAFDSTGIDKWKIINNARVVNNGPKHDRTTPDPNLYKASLEEVRRIIRYYIDEDAKLEFIDDSLYGDGQEWYEILEETSEFNSAYSYVLITRRIDNIDVRGLFSIKWDLIIDMDSESDIDGLAHNYTGVTGITPNIRTLDKENAVKKFSLSHKPYWVLANGNADIPETVVDPKKWGSAHGKYLTGLLGKFHREYSQPVKAFVFPIRNERNLRRIVDAFNDEYDSGDEIDFYVLSADNEYSSIDDENFRISQMSIEEFAENLGKYNQNNQFASSLIKRELPAENGKQISVDDNFSVELEDSFDTVYIDIDREDELDSEKCNRISFYKGTRGISWYGLREHFDVIQPEQKNIEDKIDQDMKDRGRLLRKVYYIPGIGGTTLMRRLAWNFREQYPTFILNRLNTQTGANLQKVYNLTHRPLLIFADNNVIEYDEVKNLQIELKRMGFAYVICYFQRKLKGIRDENEGSAYAVVRKFGDRETRQMQAKLRETLSNDKVDIFDELVAASDNSDRIPFVLSLYAYDKEFRGIKSYIANFLEKMNDQSKKILFALALADFGNVSVDIHYFMNLFNDESVDKFLLEESPGINELVRVEEISGKITIRIRHHLFGEEILKQMSNGRDAADISLLNLVDNILNFIEDSRNNAYNLNQDTLNLLRSLFITRKADVNAEKPVFSPLIMKLREEHRTVFDNESYDPSIDAIVRIFNKLVEIYPEEPHFTAHLARFYFYIDKNYEKGFSNIDRAIELSESETGHVDALLYHMKAMGYSSRITNIYKRDILRNIRNDPQYDASDLIQKIQEDSEYASQLFAKVRDSNIGVAGHVSEINMCIQIADLAKRMLDETEDYTEYIASEGGKWAMQYIDRAETLWDECKQLAPDSTYEDLDGIEEKLYSITASVTDSINIWEKYIANSGNKNRTQARRILARSYLKAADQEKQPQNKKTFYSKIVQLMEDNIAEESQHAGNIRIWFDSIKRLEVENQDQLMQDAIIKLNRWVNLTDSVEAHYYRFVLKFIQAIDGSVLAEGDLPRLLRELKQKAANKYNRTMPRHWLSKEGKGINALISNSRNRKNVIPEDEMAEMLCPLIGRISNNYVNESHAYINWNGVEVYFNPSATKGEISKGNIGQRVSFGIGFSYDGPRAYNSSIKLLGRDDYVETRREVTNGLIVKCEVTKNVGYYVQVRIINSNEIGSIHVDELLAPYSADNRPSIGSILEGKILMKRFDNARHVDVWQITMNMDNIEENVIEETAMAHAMRKGGIKL